jgi:hypothetical protein
MSVFVGRGENITTLGAALDYGDIGADYKI